MDQKMVRDVKSLNDEDLNALAALVQTERTRRENEARDKLIANFQKAYFDLRDAHVSIKFYDNEWEENPVYLDGWDGFEFC